MLHDAIFGVTEKGGIPDVRVRALQKNFVDALLTAAAEHEGVKINKKLREEGLLPVGLCHVCNHEKCVAEEKMSRRELNFYSSHTNRISDAISVKRGEIMRLRTLLKARQNIADKATKYHYNDLIMRINTAMGLQY